MGVSHRMEAADVLQPDVLGRRGPHGGHRGPARAGARPGVPRGRRPDPCRSHGAILERGKEEFRGPLWRRRPGRFSIPVVPLALLPPRDTGLSSTIDVIYRDLSRDGWLQRY